MPDRSAVLLLSGGLDSTTLLALASAEGYVIHALTFRYGQRHAQEVEVARRIERHYGAHQDVEWAIARSLSLPEALLVVQARPVTTRPGSEPRHVVSALSLVLGAFGAPGDAEPRV